MRVQMRSGGPKYNQLEMAMLAIGSVAVFMGFYTLFTLESKPLVGMWSTIAMVSAIVGTYSRRKRS